MQVRNQNIPSFQGKHLKIESGSLKRGLNEASQLNLQCGLSDKNDPRKYFEAVKNLEGTLDSCVKDSTAVNGVPQNRGVKVVIKGPARGDKNTGLRLVATTNETISVLGGFGKKFGKCRIIFPTSYIAKLSELDLIYALKDSIANVSAQAYANLGRLKAQMRHR